MGSIDAEVEIDMEISDDEQEREREMSKGPAVAGQVANGRVVKSNSPAGQPSTDKTDSSRKRKRSSFLDTSPSVHIEYHNLSRESRRKLQDLLRDWSMWQGYHGRHQSSESEDSPLESGDERYYPALQIGHSANSFSMSFWVDKPPKQACRKEAGDSRRFGTPSSQDSREDEAEVPLYDRVTPSLSSQEPQKDGYIEVEREATRCFNCGSYSHALRDCKRQWNFEAINSARSSHASKKPFASGPRSASRYYEINSSVQEQDRAPLLNRADELSYPPGYLGKDASRSFSGSEKEEKNHKLPGTEDNEEGEIVDDVASSGAEEELYIAFSADTDSQPDRIAADYPGIRLPFNSVPDRMWRTPPPTFSPSSHPQTHHYYQRSVSYSPQTPVFPQTTSPGFYGGVTSQRSWPDRIPHRSWDEKNMYFTEKSSAPAPERTSTPIAIPVPKKDDDDWELNFESSVYQSEGSRSSVGAPGVVGYYTPSVRHHGLTLNTITGFSPPDPSQLSPTGSGYGESFRPSDGPQTVQYQYSYHSTQIVEPNPSDAWVKAQAALSSLQSDEKGGGG